MALQEVGCFLVLPLDVAVEEMAPQEDGWLPVAALVEQLERNMMQGTLSSSSNWNQKFKFAVKN
jgi:hypothetical protein